MPDIFISYARSTEVQARRIGDALRDLGYGVWRDDELPPHRDYAEVIEERLRAAKAVVVVWSAEAVKSQWVRAEADLAREAGTLVQLSLDGAVPPLPFNRIQCADMHAWSGDLAAPGWKRVAASIAELFSGRRTGPARGALVAPQPVPAETLLAVLAFDNLSGDPEMTYFSDGVSEEIQETVARGSAIKVIGKASSFQFRGADKAASNVGAALKATHILDGSVRRSGQRVRVSAQLVECARSTTLWSERYDRDLTDIFALQDEIAAEVAAALKTAFAPTGPPGSVDPVAYDLYLRARKARRLGAAERVEMLERVVALAPGFALAWVDLASWRFDLAQRERGRPAFAPGLDGVRAALDVAERLDPALGATRFQRALLEPYAAYARREALCREALGLTPGDPNCLTGLGRFLGYVGRRREAVALGEEAAARDPLSPVPEVIRLWLGDADYEARIARYDASRVLWPATFEFGNFAAWLTACAGDWTKYEALAPRVRAQPLPEVEARMMHETFEFCEALRDGDNAHFDRLVGEMESNLARRRTVRLDTAARAAQAGRIDETFAALARASFDEAFEPGGGWGGGLLGGWGAGVIFDPVLNGAMIRDPRFLQLCAKLGLVRNWLDSGSWPDCADAVPYDFRAEARRWAELPI
jgi:adenylate cyclase